MRVKHIPRLETDLTLSSFCKGADADMRFFVTPSDSIAWPFPGQSITKTTSQTGQRVGPAQWPTTVLPDCTANT